MRRRPIPKRKLHTKRLNYKDTGKVTNDFHFKNGHWKCFCDYCLRKIEMKEQNELLNFKEQLNESI